MPDNTSRGFRMWQLHASACYIRMHHVLLCLEGQDHAEIGAYISLLSAAVCTVPQAVFKQVASNEAGTTRTNASETSSCMRLR